MAALMLLHGAFIAKGDTDQKSLRMLLGVDYSVMQAFSLSAPTDRQAGWAVLRFR